MAHVIAFAGEYDLADKTALRREFGEAALSKDLVLDLSEVTYLDSTFVGELIRLARTRRDSGLTSLTLVVKPNSNVRTVLTIAGIPRLMNVVESYKRSD